MLSKRGGEGKRKAAEYFLAAMVFIVFLIIIYRIHIPMEIVSDDAYNLEHGLNRSNVFEWIRDRFYSNGKFLTDGAALLLYLIPFNAWKVLDTLVYGVILFMLWRLFTDRSVVMLAICAGLEAAFPIFFLMRSAGYIATSANYVYAVAALLLGMAPLVRTIRREGVSVLLFVLSLMGIIFSSNQDQTAMIAIGGFLMTGILYFLKNKAHGKGLYRRVLAVSSVYFLISLAAYILMFLTPGHIARMKSTAEMEYYLPQFAGWSTGFKLYRGMATTFAWLFFSQPVLLRLFCLELLAVCCIRKTKAVIFPILLTAVLFVVSMQDSSHFVIVHEYAYYMPDLKPVQTDPGGLILSIVLLALMILSVLALWRSDRDLCAWLVILNILGFGSRFMMGFSATLYASSFRTFTPQLFCFMICCILLAGDFLDRLAVLTAKRLSFTHPQRKKKT